MRNLIFMLCFSLISKLAYTQDLQAEIIGIWKIQAFDSEKMITTLQRTKTFKKNTCAYEFMESGEVLVRINSIGCVVVGKNRKSHSILSNVIGSWRLINEKQIEVNYETFMMKTLEIAELNDGRLKLRRKQEE
jgi:hypothetical protein